MIEPNKYTKMSRTNCIATSSDPTASTNRDDHKLRLMSYDALISSLQAEVHFYKTQHESLRCQILDVTSEAPHRDTTRPTSECQCTATADLMKHKKLTDATISNLQEQLRRLGHERDTTHTLWRTAEKTIANFEIELTEYKRLCRQPDSVMLIKEEFAIRTRVHEGNVAKLKAELSAQQQCTARLTESNTVLSQQMAAIDEKYKSFLLEHSKSLNEVQQSENTLNLAKSRLVDELHQRNELEQQLNHMQAQLQEYADRELVLLTKIQEALQLADTAVEERNKALQRELDTRDECEHLATNIGQVMEEAATACERSLSLWQGQYEKRIKHLREHIVNLTTSKAALTKRLTSLGGRADVLEDTVKTMQTSNATLDAELQIASKTIIEMEMKLQAFEKLLDQEREAKQIIDERSQELHEFLVQNNKLKQRWKATVDEAMAKLQTEVAQLHAQNAALKRENDAMQEHNKTTMNNRGNFLD